MSAPARLPAPRRAARGASALGRALLAGFVFGSSPVGAVDPTIGLRLESAPAPSPAATPRLDPNGTNQTSALLPEHPTLVWQTRLAPPLVGDPTAGARGTLLVAHASDRATALDEKGQPAWSLRVGAELATAPLPLAGGRSLLVTRDARVIWVSAGGTAEGRETLPWGPLEQAPVVTTTRDGGAIIAAGATLARLGPRGARGYDARFPDPIRAVFDWQGETVAVGHGGGIFARAGSGDPVRVGGFETPVRAVALVEDRLFGIGRNELVTFDLVKKERKVVLGEPTAEMRELALLGGGRIRLVAAGAVLVDIDANGRELARLPLRIAETGSEVSSIVTDRAGRALVVTGGASLLQITPQGDVSTLPDSACLDPIRPTPVANGRVVVACRSGLVRAFSDRAR